MKFKQRLENSSDWILNSKEAMVILFLMATIIGSTFFSLICLSMLLAKEYFFAALFAFFAYGSISKLIGIIKSMKLVGFKDALGGWTANNMVWHKDKYGRRTDKDGHDGCSSEECNEGKSETDGTSGEGLRSNNRESERTNTWTNFVLQRSDSVMQETGHDRRRNSKTNN